MVGESFGEPSYPSDILRYRTTPNHSNIKCENVKSVKGNSVANGIIVRVATLSQPYTFFTQLPENGYVL